MADDNDSSDDSIIERFRRADPRLTIAARDFQSLRYEKTIVMALLVQLVIASFSSFLVLGLVSVYSAESDVSRIGVTGNATEPIETEMADEEELKAFEYTDGQSLARGVRDDDVDAGVIADRGSNGRLEVTLLIPDEELETTILITQLKDSLEDVENAQRIAVSDSLDAQVLSYPDVDASNPYFTFTYTVLIPLLIFLPIFISGSILVDSVTEEIERQTMELLEVTPTSLTGIIDAKVVVASLLAPGQAALWLLLLRVNGIRIEHPFALLAFTLSLAALFVAIGTAIALWLRSRQHAQLVYSGVLIVAFAGLSVLPQPPANVAARLAAGSTVASTYATILGVGVVAIGVYAFVRSRIESIARR